MRMKEGDLKILKHERYAELLDWKMVRSETSNLSLRTGPA